MEQVVDVIFASTEPFGLTIRKMCKGEFLRSLVCTLGG